MIQMWYIWIILAVLTIISVLVVYYKLIKTKNNVDQDSLKTIAFELKSTIQKPQEHSTYMHSIAYSPKTSTGFLTLYSEGEKNALIAAGYFFSFSSISNQITMYESIVQDAGQCVMYLDIAIIFNIKENVSYIYKLVHSTWTKTDEKAQIIPHVILLRDDASYCVGVGADKQKTSSLKMYNITKKQLSHLATFENDNFILTMDYDTINKNIYFVDSVFDLYMYSFDTLKVTKIQSLWSSIAQNPNQENKANIKISDGVMVVNLHGTNSSMFATYSLSQKKFTTFKKITTFDVDVQVTHLSALPDLSMIAFCSQVDIDVYRTDTNLLPIDKGNEQQLTGDPALVTNYNSKTSLLTYTHDKKEIVLFCGGASREFILSVYIMNNE
jgi:hypothetical protein